MNRARHPDAFDARLSLGLRELDGAEAPPDLTARVLAGQTSGRSRNRSPLPAVAASVLVALGAAAAVAVWHRQNSTVQPRLPSDQEKPTQLQDKPPRSQAVRVRSAAEIAALPLGTSFVFGIDLHAAELRALQRLPNLRGLILHSDLAASDVATLSRLDKLQTLALEYELTPRAAQALSTLRHLPRLKSLTVAKASLGDAVLADLGTIPALRSLELMGELVCSAKAMAAFAKAAHGLRALTVITLRDNPGRASASIHPGGLWEALPTTLTELRLAHQWISIPALRRLPRLRTLDLEHSQVLGDGFLAFARHRRGTTITMPTGHTFQVGASGALRPTVERIELRRRTTDAYGKAAYSFRRRSQHVHGHSNHVDVVFNRCGRLHLNPYDGSDSRLLDLGAAATIPQLDQLPRDGWCRDSIAPRAGHRYVLQIGERGVLQPFPVSFRILTVEPDRVVFEWQPLDLTMARTEPLRFLAGNKATMGRCDGPH